MLGSLLGAAIITGSVVVGDTMDASIRQVARTHLGPIDELVDGAQRRRAGAAPARTAAARVRKHRRGSRVHDDRRRRTATGAHVRARSATLSIARRRLRAGRPFRPGPRGGGDLGPYSRARACGHHVRPRACAGRRSRRQHQRPRVGNTDGAGRRPHPAAARSRGVLDGHGAGVEQRAGLGEDVRRDSHGERGRDSADVADRDLEQGWNRERCGPDRRRDDTGACRSRARPVWTRRSTPRSRPHWRRRRRWARASPRCSPRWGASACLQVCCYS